MTKAAPNDQTPASNIDLEETLHSLGLERLASENENQRGALTPDEDIVRESKIMIVDDEAYNVLVVRKFLQHTGYTNFITSTESPKAIDLMKRDLPDVVLLDIMMPEVSGLEILRCMKMDAELATIPVIILTTAPEASVKHQALQLGAHDFLSKPVEPTELVLRVRNVLAAKSHFDNLANYSVKLERQVRERTQELIQSRQQIIYCLARAAEFRDNETRHHVIRVGKYAGVIADEMGFAADQVESIELAAQLHDVGKIGIAFCISRENLIPRNLPSSRSTPILVIRSSPACRKTNGTSSSSTPN